MPYLMGDFQLDERMMRYSVFVPRFYNLCRSYGFEPGRIMPSRSFCSDESQGFPIILITKHFGTFPFDHGRVGGIVSTDRHGPHAHHGRDLAIIQASHVGYDPETGNFGAYRRLQVDNLPFTTACGKICGVMDWYQREYDFARENVAFVGIDGAKMVIIDNQLLDNNRGSGLLLNFSQLVDMADGQLPEPLRVFSTSKAFPANPEFAGTLPKSTWVSAPPTPIGERLVAALFSFRRTISNVIEGHDHLEKNLSHSMPRILTSPFPALAAAQANTQIEFDRTYRTIVKETGYQEKNLAFIAGINIDISPEPGQLFPLTKFVPWALYVQTRDGQRFTLEQDELLAALTAQSTDNPDQIDMESAIQTMIETPEIKIHVPGRPSQG